jgi:hypothetical protein
MIDNNQNWRPILKSLSASTQSILTSGTGTYNGSSDNIQYFSSNSDAAYVISPNFRLVVYSQENYQGSPVLDITNTNHNPVLYAPTVNGTANSWMVYYNNNEI